MPLNALAWQPEYETVWTVGYYGALLKNDGVGSDFTNQIRGPINWLHSVCFIDDERGFAVGADGTLLQTTDKGDTWTERRVSSSELRSLFFLDETNGWIVGREGTILRTSNGGNTWVTQESGVTNLLTDVHFADEDTGWATGRFGVILHTENGGGDWILQVSGTMNDLWSLRFVNASEGWAVGLDSTVRHTTDGGNTWKSKDVNASRNYRFTSVFFLDEQYGWIVGIMGGILRTTDGGDTWEEIRGVGYESLNSVQFIDPNTGWAAGFHGVIYRTDDGGITWHEQSSGCQVDLTDICFTTENNGIAVGENGTILRTTDGGWTTDIPGEHLRVPERALLAQNYPNPFNPATTIQYGLPEQSYVHLAVYDITGRKIVTLVNTHCESGWHEVLWDGMDSHGRPVSAGVYLYRLETPTLDNAGKMILMK